MNYSKKQWAQINDQRVWEAAVYCVTDGLRKTVDPLSPEVHQKFIEFKSFIKRGEFTLDELEDKVYSDYGIMPTYRDVFLDTLKQLSDAEKQAYEQKKKNAEQKDKHP